MTLIDYVVIVAYLIGTLAVGFYFYRRNKSADDMFAAGAQSPWWVAGLSGFMTLMSAGTFVVWGGLAYSDGLVAISIVTSIGIAGILVGLFVAGHWRRIGVGTPAEFIELRFGRGAVHFYTWTMMAVRMLSAGVALYAVAVMLVNLVPLPPGNLLRDDLTGNLSIVATILIFGTIIILYTVAGGLWAVLMTDVLQFIVLKLAVLFIIPLLIFQVMAAPSLAPVPDTFFNLTSHSYSSLFLIGWVAVHFFTVGAEWAFAQRYICVPSVKDAKKSAILFGVLYLISPIIWLTPTVLYRLLDPSANPEAAYILASKSVLPAGMLGLMIAAMFSAAASSISGQLNVFAGVLAEQFYRPIFRPRAQNREMLWAGRIATLAIGLVIVLIAIFVPRLGGAQQIVLTIAGLLIGPLMAPALWGLLSGRIGRSAVYSTAIISIGLGVFLKFGIPAIASLKDTEAAIWIATNPRMVDVMVGAVVPTLILTIAHFLAGSNGAAWAELERRKSRYAPTPLDPDAAGDHSPAVVTWVALAATGLVMLALLPFNSEGRGALTLFGLALLALAVAIWGADRNQAARRSTVRAEPIET